MSDALARLFRETAGLTGEAFFRAVASGLARILGGRAWAEELHAEGCRMLAAAGPGASEQDLARSALVDEVLARGGAVLQVAGASDRWPDDPRVAGMQVFLGVSVPSSTGEAIGLIGACRDAPFDGAIDEETLRALAVRAGAVLERQRTERKLMLALLRADALARIAHRLAAEPDNPRAALVEICDEVRGTLGVSAANVLLLDEELDAFVRVAGAGEPEELVRGAVPTPRALFEANASLFAPLAVIEDVQAMAHLPNAARYTQSDLRSVALVALEAGGTLVGMLSAFTFEELRTFTTDDRQWLQAVGDLISQTLRAYRDTTRALSGLRASEEKYRRIVATIPDGVWVIDAAGNTTFVNEQMERMLGYEPGEMLGRPMYDFMDERARHEAAANMERRRRGIREQHEFCLRKKDGSGLWTVMSASPFAAEDGQFTGALAIVADLTERRSLELRIQQAQKLESLGVLAGGIAHDFNNLLVGILGNVGIANLDLPPESPVAPVLADIQTAALRAADLTKQLLAYAGKGRFVVERLDLNRLVSEMTHLLTTVVSKKAALRLDLAPKLPPIEADATQIRQVVMNLITNASDSLGEQPGIISVTTGVVDADRDYLDGTYLDDRLSEGRYVFLEVRDNGCGMDEVTRAKIFDPFFSTKFTGRGLGLAAVLGILRSHGGAVKVYSEPGRGSSFKVLIPVVPGVAVATERGDAGASEWRGSGIVLVVDDEDSVRTVARRVLERAGFEVLVAGDGREAVDLFRQRAGDIAIVLLDMTMPRLSGDEAFRELRHIRPDVRVVLSSGYSEQEATQRFAGKALTSFLQKPWSASELVAAMRAALERA